MGGIGSVALEFHELAVAVDERHRRQPIGTAGEFGRNRPQTRNPAAVMRAGDEQRASVWHRNDDVAIDFDLSARPEPSANNRLAS
jgi:hypothetical protein